MNIIKRITQCIKYQSVTIKLPYYITKILRAHEQAKDIEFEKFIIDSLKNHWMICSSKSHTQNSQGEILTLKIPRLLMLQIWWTAKAERTAISNIATEALSFSIPILMEEIQAQEDYRIEFEQQEN